MLNKNLRSAQNWDCMSLFSNQTWFSQIDKIPQLRANISLMCQIMSQPFVAGTNILQQVVNTAGLKYEYEGADALGKYIADIASEFRNNLDQLKKISTAMRYFEPGLSRGDVLNKVAEDAVKYGAIPANIPTEASLQAHLRTHTALAQAKIGDLLLAASNASMSVSETNPNNAYVTALLLPTTIGRNIEKQVEFLSAFGLADLWGLDPFSVLINIRAGTFNNAISRLIYTVALVRSPESAMKILEKIKEFIGVLDSEIESQLYNIINQGELASASATAEITALKTQLYQDQVGQFWLAFVSIVPELRKYMDAAAKKDLLDTINILMSTMMYSGLSSVTSKRGQGTEKKSAIHEKNIKTAQDRGPAPVIEDIGSALAGMWGIIETQIRTFFGAAKTTFKSLNEFSTALEKNLNTAFNSFKIPFDNIAQLSNLNIDWVAENTKAQEMIRNIIVEVILSAVKQSLITEEMLSALNSSDKEEVRSKLEEFLSQEQNLSSIILRKISSSFNSDRIDRPEGIDDNYFKALREATDVQSLLGLWQGLNMAIQAHYSKIDKLGEYGASPTLGGPLVQTQNITSMKPNIFESTYATTVTEFIQSMEHMIFNEFPDILVRSQQIISTTRSQRARSLSSAPLRAEINKTITNVINYRIEAEFLLHRAPLENRVRFYNSQINRLKAHHRILKSKANFALAPGSSITLSIFNIAQKKAGFYQKFINNIRSAEKNVLRFLDKVLKINSNIFAQFIGTPEKTLPDRISELEVNMKNYSESIRSDAEAEQANAIAEGLEIMESDQVGLM